MPIQALVGAVATLPATAAPAAEPGPEPAPSAQARSRVSTCWVVAVLLLVLGLASLGVIGWAVYRAYRQSSTNQQTECLNNLKKLGTALAMYVTDYDSRLPLKDNWQAGLSGYLGGTLSFDCPAAGNQTSYLYNDRLDGLPMSQVQDPGYCAAVFDEPLTDPNRTRHRGGDNCLFVDGHAATIAPTATADFTLDPTVTRAGASTPAPAGNP